jgi:HSP20 family protein
MTRRPTDRNIGVVPFRSALEQIMGWPVSQMDRSLTELAPPIDVRETNDAYVVEIDLPGIDPENVEVLIEGRTLSIRGHFEQEEEKNEGGYLLKERRSGDFVRAIALPGMVDTESAQSKVDNGVLEITLPKAVQNRARRIKIQGWNGQTKKSQASQAGQASQPAQMSAGSERPQRSEQAGSDAGTTHAARDASGASRSS